jgi:hypothetical protein
VLVKFVDVLLGLGHVGEDFEFGAETAFHFLEAEGDLLDGGAHLFEVLVLVHPLLRNVIDVHLLLLPSIASKIEKREDILALGALVWLGR